MNAEKIMDILSVVSRCIGIVKRMIGKITGKNKPQNMPSKELDE
ncbi:MULTISPECIES: hypothetical protein [Parabacteroides]|uniref:Cyclic lactone autoinducer peptide n=1 Tax=Parabacteroides chinchillae TaxID=871327 RepID=A0A8G2BWH2_9BACT|nr:MULTISPECIES: hypothetical protein [Parabacteroides]SEF89091.1 hypothetical protein SAMN05444001_1091 [Parabacteroides chinchillae]